MSDEAAVTSKNDQADGRHDFDFFLGVWGIANRKLADPLAEGLESRTWLEFEATAKATPILAGLGNHNTYSAPDFPGAPTFMVSRCVCSTPRPGSGGSGGPQRPGVDTLTRPLSVASGAARVGSNVTTSSAGGQGALRLEGHHAVLRTLGAVLFVRRWPNVRQQLDHGVHSDAARLSALYNRPMQCARGCAPKTPTKVAFAAQTTTPMLTGGVASCVGQELLTEGLSNRPATRPVHAVSRDQVRIRVNTGHVEKRR